MNITLQEIKDLSPVPNGYGERTAFYSISCGWWTSFPDDLGQTPPLRMKATQAEAPASLPCCPHCHSLLMESSLEDFIERAELVPESYGRFGLSMFEFTHARNSLTCFRQFEDYEPMLIASGEHHHG